MEHYTIKLPRGIWNFFKRQSLKRRLNNKLTEYLNRARTAILQGDNDRKMDTFHKIEVLEELLERGRVDTAALAERMQSLPGFDLVIFERGCDVIYAYVCGAPGILRGGTGLPK